MLALFLLLALLLVLVGHAFRLLRWEQFIRIYERPPRGQMLRGMAGGYALNFVLPFHLGDAFRAVYTGRRMKSGIGFALATVIMDRFLDVWFVAFGFIAFRLLGLGGAPVDGAARYYLPAPAQQHETAVILVRKMILRAVRRLFPHKTARQNPVLHFISNTAIDNIALFYFCKQIFRYHTTSPLLSHFG